MEWRRKRTTASIRAHPRSFASPAHDVFRRLVVFRAHVLLQLFFRGKRQRSVHLPWLRVRARVVERVLNLQAPQVGSAKPFDDVHLLGLRMLGERQRDFIVEAHRIDNQRIALPTAHGVPLPRREGVLRMLASVQKDLTEARVTAFDQNHKQVGSLHELRQIDFGSKHDACWEAQRTRSHTRGEPLFPLRFRGGQDWRRLGIRIRRWKPDTGEVWLSAGRARRGAVWGLSHCAPKVKFPWGIQRRAVLQLYVQTERLARRHSDVLTAVLPEPDQVDGDIVGSGGKSPQLVVRLVARKGAVNGPGRGVAGFDGRPRDDYAIAIYDRAHEGRRLSVRGWRQGAQQDGRHSRPGY